MIRDTAMRAGVHGSLRRAGVRDAAKRPSLRRWAGAAALLASLTGCGSNDTFPPLIDVEDGIRLGWEAFERADYGRAEALFLATLRTDGRSAEARRGLGWTRAYAGDLDGAAANFEAALTLEMGHVDALAGLAAVEHALGEWSAAIGRAREALARDASWAFAHRAGVDAEDLRLIVAQAAALLGPALYDDAQAELDLLDPANGLDAADDATWVVDGETYATYRDALFAAIELVERRVGAPLP